MVRIYLMIMNILLRFSPFAILSSGPGYYDHVSRFALPYVAVNRGFYLSGVRTMTSEPDQPRLNFRNIPGKKGHYYCDGMIAELLWNPWEQLGINRWTGERYQKEKSQRPRAYELLRTTRTAESYTGYQEEIIETPDTCEWCYQEMTLDANDIICFSCRYRSCKSCGVIFKAYNKSAVTCSTECANILHGKRGRWMILERDNFTCIYCGLSSPADHAMLHVDHIIPVDDGGKSHAGNLITACQACNSQKSASRMTAENEERILAVAAERNNVRGIDGSQVIRLREND